MVLASELEARKRAGEIRHDVTVLSYSPGPVDTPMQAMAQASSTETLPIVDMFVRWRVEGPLLSPDAPAAEILQYVESDSHPSFAERRYGDRL